MGYTKMRITEGARAHIEDQMRIIRIMVGDADEKVLSPVNKLLLSDLRTSRPMIEKATDIETVIKQLQGLVKNFEVFESPVANATIALLKNLIEDLEMQPA
jgi:hypothetical protein